MGISLKIALFLMGIGVSQAFISSMPVQRNKEFNRIIDGTAVKPNAYPFLVSLRDTEYEVHFCGGSLLNERYILTAAHCIYYPKANINTKPEEIIVVLGEHHIYRKEGHEVTRNVDKIVLHETYPNGESIFDSDIAILRLSEPVELNEFIQPICISAKPDLSSQYPTVAGWGQTLEEFTSEVPLEIEVPVLDDFWCEDAFRKNYYAPHMICAGYPWMPHNHKDVCQGDSGGPLFLNPKFEKPSQVGIVSFNSALGCALKNYPSAFTRVSEFVDWIRSHVVGDVCVM